MPISEEWRPIVGWEDLYEVSSHGRVRSLPRTVRCKDWYRGPLAYTKAGRILKASPDGYGYPMVSLYRDGERTGARVHTMVAEAFIGPCPKGQLVAHNDGNPANPWFTNLRYDTFKGNFADKVKHGTYTSGEKHSRAKLTQAQVDEIRSLRRNGLKYREIAPLFGIHPAHVGQLVRGGRWKSQPKAA